MKIQAIPAFQDNYIWAIINDNQQLIVVDPGDANPVIEFANKHGLSLEAILITHHHADHIGGMVELKQRFADCQIYGPIDTRICGLDHLLSGGQSLDIDSLHFQILATPGHTSTHISYYEPNLGWLFCGDTLFSAGCGRVFDGSYEQLYTSLGLYKQLPEDTKVFCAHEYTQNNLRFAASVDPENQEIIHYLKALETKSQSLPSTIGLEKQVNPFLRTNSAAMIKLGKSHDIAQPQDFQRFCYLRKLKDRW